MEAGDQAGKTKYLYFTVRFGGGIQRVRKQRELQVKEAQSKSVKQAI